MINDKTNECIEFCSRMRYKLIVGLKTSGQYLFQEIMEAYNTGTNAPGSENKLYYRDRSDTISHRRACPDMYPPLTRLLMRDTIRVFNFFDIDF